MLDYKISQTEHKFSQITSSTNIRQKRGLINGLGSIWKSITGNLDQEDADRYDKVIIQLKDNQKKIVNVADQQISLTQKALHVFNDSMVKLQHNQIRLNERILQISDIMEQIHIEIVENHTFIMINAIFNQLLASIEIISQILNTIENAITFSKLNTLQSTSINY